MIKKDQITNDISRRVPPPTNDSELLVNNKNNTKSTKNTVKKIRNIGTTLLSILLIFTLIFSLSYHQEIFSFTQQETDLNVQNGEYIDNIDDMSDIEEILNNVTYKYVDYSLGYNIYDSYGMIRIKSDNDLLNNVLENIQLFCALLQETGNTVDELINNNRKIYDDILVTWTKFPSMRIDSDLIEQYYQLLESSENLINNFIPSLPDNQEIHLLRDKTLIHCSVNLSYSSCHNAIFFFNKYDIDDLLFSYHGNAAYTPELAIEELEQTQEKLGDLRDYISALMNESTYIEEYLQKRISSANENNETDVNRNGVIHRVSNGSSAYTNTIGMLKAFINELSSRKENPTENKDSMDYAIGALCEAINIISDLEEPIQLHWSLPNIDEKDIIYSSSCNLQDTISFIQTMLGAANELHEIDQRVIFLMTELLNMSDELNETNKENLNKEIYDWIQEYNRILRITCFNDFYFLSSPGKTLYCPVGSITSCHNMITITNNQDLSLSPQSSLKDIEENLQKIFHFNSQLGALYQECSYLLDSISIIQNNNAEIYNIPVSDDGHHIMNVDSSLPGRVASEYAQRIDTMNKHIAALTDRGESESDIEACQTEINAIYDAYDIAADLLSVHNVPINIIWRDKDNYDNVRPDNIKLTFTHKTLPDTISEETIFNNESTILSYAYDDSFDAGIPYDITISDTDDIDESSEKTISKYDINTEYTVNDNGLCTAINIVCTHVGTVRIPVTKYWNDRNNETGQRPDSINVNMTPYIDSNAKKKVQVIYQDGCSGSVFASQTYTASVGDNTPVFVNSDGGSEPKRDGYVFDGWSQTVSKTISSEQVRDNNSIVYTAKWQKLINIGWYDGYTDTPIKTETIEENRINDKLFQELQPIGQSRDGYFFDGWDKYVESNGNINFTAKWYKHTIYTFVYLDENYNMICSEGWEGNSGQIISFTLDELKEKISIPEGYVLDTDRIPSKITLTLQEESRYNEIPIFLKKATISDKTYTIIYKDGTDDFVFSDQGYEDLHEGDLIPPFEGTTERSGYIFMGWAPAISPTINGEMADANGIITYMATWKKAEKVVYTVEWYDIEGNILATDERISYVGAICEVKDNDKQVNGYIFDANNQNNILSAKCSESGATLRLYFMETKEIPVSITTKFCILEDDAPDFPINERPANYNIKLSYTDVKGEHQISLSSGQETWNYDDSGNVYVTFPSFNVVVGGLNTTYSSVPIHIVQSSYFWGGNDEIKYEYTRLKYKNIIQQNAGSVYISSTEDSFNMEIRNYYSNLSYAGPTDPDPSPVSPFSIANNNETLSLPRMLISTPLYTQSTTVSIQSDSDNEETTQRNLLGPMQPTQPSSTSSPIQYAPSISTDLVPNDSDINSNKWDCFVEVPSWDPDTEEFIDYGIDEEDIDCYALTNVSGDSDTGFELTNTLTGEVMVRKVWYDDNNYENRPESVIVSLTSTPTSNQVNKPPISLLGRAVAQQNGYNTSTTVKLQPDENDPTSNEWYAPATVPLYDDKGELLDYTLSENNIKGYWQVGQSGSLEENMFTIYNSSVVDKVEVEKSWNDNDDEQGIRPEKVKLMLNGVPYANPLLSAESNQSPGLVLGLLTRSNGDDNSNGTQEQSDGHLSTGYPATHESIRPTTSIELSANDDGEWIGEFKNIPIYDMNGKRNYYSIIENDCNDYTISDVSLVLDENKNIKKYLVTNSYTYQDTTITVAWDDEDNKYGERPDTVNVVLEAANLNEHLDGLESPIRPGDDMMVGVIQQAGSSMLSQENQAGNNNGDRDTDMADDNNSDDNTSIGGSNTSTEDYVINVTLTAADNWTTTLNNVPAYYPDGSKVDWVISQDDVEGYDLVSTSGNLDEGFTVTNRIKPHIEMPFTGSNLFIILIIAGGLILELATASMFLRRNRKTSAKSKQ